jgi:ribosomal protein S18 acetylase RimI-like enzyme
MLTVCRMEPEKLPFVAALAQQEIYPENELGVIEAWFRGFGGFPFVQFFVATEGDKLLGALVWGVLDILEDEYSLELSSIVTKNGHRGQGIARELIRQSLRMAKESPILREMELSVVIVETEPRNEEAIRFYRRFGPFQETVIQNHWRKAGEDVLFFYLRPENILGEAKGAP